MLTRQATTRIPRSMDSAPPDGPARRIVPGNHSELGGLSHATTRAPSRYQPCFHGIGRAARELEPGEDVYWVTPDRYLDVLDLVTGRDDVRISFDDGNRSDLVHGLPGLVERGLTAEFFLIASRLDQTGSLGTDDVAELLSHGMSIGSHGMHHQSWRECGPSALEEELVQARDLRPRPPGRPVDTAACPLGLYDRRVLSELRRRGYRRVMTSDRAAANPRAWLQPRFSIRRDDTVESVADLLDKPDGALRRLAARGRITLKGLR